MKNNIKAVVPALWKPVHLFESIYTVSSHGQVSSADRMIVQANGHLRKIKGRILKPTRNSDGYLQVTLKHSPLKKTLYVHRLVAEAFIPKPAGKNEVNHINGIKDDNNADNLEWVTREGNMLHARQYGVIKNTGTGHFRSLPLIRQSDGMTFDSIKQLSEELNINYSTLKTKILSGKLEGYSHIAKIIPDTGESFEFSAN